MLKFLFLTEIFTDVLTLQTCYQTSQTSVTVFLDLNEQNKC